MSQGQPPHQPGWQPFAVPQAAQLPGPSYSSPRWCPHHHQVSAVARFCDVCGAPVAELQPSPPSVPNQPVVAPTGPLTSKRIVLGVVSLALVFAVVVVGSLLPLGQSGSPTAASVVPAPAVVPDVMPPTTTVAGRLTLTDYETAANDCVGEGGYSDIEPGAGVILTSESGKTLGSSSLVRGGPGNGRTCNFVFAIADVPQDAAQYAIEVSHRGKVVDSREELEANDWTFEVTLGS